MGRENFDAHPAHLAKGLALSLNVLVGPAEHLNDTTFLTIFVNFGLVDSGVLPNEVRGLRLNGKLVTIIVCGFHN